MVAAHCWRTFSESMTRWKTRNWLTLDPGCLQVIVSFLVVWIKFRFDLISSRCEAICIYGKCGLHLAPEADHACGDPLHRAGSMSISTGVCFMSQVSGMSLTSLTQGVLLIIRIPGVQ